MTYPPKPASLTKEMLISIVLALAIAICAPHTSAQNPKWEFRGAWINTVYQDQYRKNTTEQNKKYISSMLDKLQEAGVNAVLFQARPSADAFYDSRYEPWSRFLTDDGKPPQPYWDPLEYIIEEAHKRGMELHAWINPYRVTTSAKQKLPKNHLYNREPKRFIKYPGDNKIYFDPGLPENRKFIVDVVHDIVTRYDVDGIHFDDYFYPYPANGKAFPDDASYAKYGKGKSRADWRRSNVNELIKMIHDDIRRSSRPWVRFGVSPFGIWRNKSSDPKGSQTNGLQNYDDLYADVLLWAHQGWIDYLIPQLYWELEHKKASYIKLMQWWPQAMPENFHLYIGQDVDRTMTKPDIAPSKEPNQLNHKVNMTRDDDRVYGNCWWPAYSITNNTNSAATALKKGPHSTIALIPPYAHLSGPEPSKINKIKIDGDRIVWKKEKNKNRVTDAVKFVVYKLPYADITLLNNPKYIYTVTPEEYFDITEPGFYTVTYIDRANNESAPSKFFNVIIE